MILAPAMGVPSEELLQDTLKSGIVALLALGTALLFFCQQRSRPSPVIWHGLMWLPLGLAVYAVGSMAWSHAYLGGVEALRWMIFSLLLWLGLNTRVEDLEGRLLWGIHWGVTVASLWAAWQFWGNLRVFPQGPNPASTFINRNFFAEYAICALPYSLFLLFKVRDFRETLSIAAGIGFNLAALMMTGTRSALIALLVLCLVWPLLVYRCWQSLAVSEWGWKKNATMLAVLAGGLLLFGSISTANPQLITEFGKQSAIDRALLRTASIATTEEYATGSFSVRAAMWAATGRMVMAHPLAGVGAGAWEVNIPVYQTAETVTETDFYAHNEPLQLLSEYGVTGVLFLGLLAGYLLISMYKTWSERSEAITANAPLRATALASLLMLLIVSNAGFPWRMASTGALFALSLSLLAATDAANRDGRQWLIKLHVLGDAHVRLVLICSTACLLVALYVSQRAAIAERSLIRSAQLAIAIGNSPDPRSPQWDATKTRMLELVREGVTLNPHYRKITPLVADQLASWGDWKNALWIWESVDASRPNVIAIISNISRAHMELGNLAKARAYFDRAHRLYPTSPVVTTLDIELLSREGHNTVAKQRLQSLFQGGAINGDLALLAYKIGSRIQDGELVVQALEWRLHNQPAATVDTLLKLGASYEKLPDVHNPEKALSSYRAALAATPEKYKEITLKRIPEPYRARLSKQ